MTVLTAEAFLKKAPRRYTETEIPGFGRIRIQSITERERADYDAGALDERGRPDIKQLALQKCRLIALCLVNEDGHRILSDQEAAQLPDLMDAATADLVFEACRVHVNGGPAKGNSPGSPGTTADATP